MIDWILGAIIIVNSYLLLGVWLADFLRSSLLDHILEQQEDEPVEDVLEELRLHQWTLVLTWIVVIPCAAASRLIEHYAIKKSEK